MSEATYTRNIIVDFPDWAGATVYFYLRTYFAAAGSEGFPKKEYALPLDGTGQGTQALPVPDNTGDAAWAWRVKTPDNNNYGGDDSPLTLAYGADLQLTAWLAAAQSGETPASLPDFFVLKAGDTMTGPLDFSGTDHGGIKFISLTTVQRDALTPAVGMVIYNTTDGEFQSYDGAWGSLGGGGGVWGAITGTLSDQTDLQAALDAKATTTNLSDHEADTTNIHGIADTAALLDTADIGVSVQANDAGLTDIAGLAVTDGNIIVGDGANWVVESGATARTSLGLGTLATQNGTFSGGGTLATGGFTLTVPATGTAALLGASQTFTAANIFTGGISAPTAGANTQVFGTGHSVGSFANVTAFGTAITATDQSATAFGRSISAKKFSVIVGEASSVAESGVSVGYNITNNFNHSIGIGNTVTVTASNQLVFNLVGGVQNTYFNGVTATSPVSTVINVAGGSGTNVAGASIGIAGGRGTGAGGGGNVDFLTAPIGASGSSANALVTAGRFDDEPLGGDATRLLLLDLSDGIIKRVVFGADDLAGAGLKPLAVAN